MTQSPATVLRATIAAPIEQFMAAFSRGDAAGAAAVYTADAQVLPPNSDVITGQQAIQTFWQGAMNLGITEHPTFPLRKRQESSNGGS